MNATSNGSWTIEHLNRLLSIARHAEGDVSGIPAGAWWQAFLLTVLDTGLNPKQLLAVKLGDYAQGRLTVGLIVYELHPVAVSAIDTLSHRSRLFPWPGSHQTLTTRFEKLVALAGIPETPHPFTRLRETARQHVDLLVRLDLTADYPPATAVSIPSEPKQHDDGNKDESDPTTLVGFAKSYPDLRLELRDTTAYLYLVVARMLTRFHGGQPLPLQSLSLELVLPWLKSFIRDGKSPATANSHRCTILTLWTMAHERGLAPIPPNKYQLPKFRVPRRNPVSWRPEQVQTLLEICEEQLHGALPSWPAISRKDYWFALILFLYESGARIGAALGVSPTDVDLKNRLVILRSNTSKTLLEQPIRISETTARAIETILDPNRDRIWPCGKRRRELYHTLTNLLTLAGLPTDRLSKFHRMRRTNATQTALHGSLEMAQHQLGHTSVQMTLRSYIDTSILKPIQAVDVLPSVVGIRVTNQGAHG